MTTLLLLMGLFTVTDYMAFDTVSNMFSITTIAFANKPSVRRSETPTDTRLSPTQLADPETSPWMMPYSQYSALMGFIINQGTLFIDSPRPEWYPEQKRLRFSSVDLSFLLFIKDYFGQFFYYGANSGITRLSNTNVSLQTMDSNLTKHLYDVWHNEVGLMILPSHFEQHFNWHTLAFWVMRNGIVQRNHLRISILTLGMQDKLRLQAVLLEKYGLTSTMQSNGSYLSIHNYVKWIDNVKPLIHESQQYRLIKK